MGRRPKLKSDEFSGVTRLVHEKISQLCEIAGDNWCSYWRRDPLFVCSTVRQETTDMHMGALNTAISVLNTVVNVIVQHSRLNVNLLLLKPLLFLTLLLTTAQQCFPLN